MMSKLQDRDYNKNKRTRCRTENALPENPATPRQRKEEEELCTHEAGLVL
jgi:hypothetical protein